MTRSDFFHYEEAVIGCCGAGGGGGETTSELLLPLLAAGDDGDPGGGTKAGGPPLLLTGADGAGIVAEDNEADCGDISEVNCSVDFVGVDDNDGRAAGAGGAPIDVAEWELLLQLLGLLLLAMIEFKCIEDLLASEGSFSEAFLESLLLLLRQDSISIVVRGPVPREHWNNTRLIMRATCWSRM